MASATGSGGCASSGSSFHARKRGRTRRPGLLVHDDLVHLPFPTEQPNQLWLTDFTGHPTGDGELDLNRPLHGSRNRRGVRFAD